MGREPWAALPTSSLALVSSLGKQRDSECESPSTSALTLLCLTQAWGTREAFLEEEAFESHHRVRVGGGTFRAVEGSELIANLVCPQDVAPVPATTLALESKAAHLQGHAEASFRPAVTTYLWITLDDWPLGSGGSWLFVYPLLLSF